MRVTGFLAAGSEIANGAQPWQMPHHVGMQRPIEASSGRPVFGCAQIEPSISDEQSLFVEHALRQSEPSTPLACDTSTIVFGLLNALPYFSAGDAFEPSHLLFRPSRATAQ